MMLAKHTQNNTGVPGIWAAGVTGLPLHCSHTLDQQSACPFHIRRQTQLTASWKAFNHNPPPPLPESSLGSPHALKYQL